MIYVLAYPEFEASCAGRIHRFREKHEPERAKLVPPHVTLVFGTSDQYLEKVMELVEVVSSQTRAFPIGFEHYEIEFDPFEKKHKIFLLCGDGADQVKALHTQLYDGEHRADRSSAHPFRPHMTIATYDMRADLERVDVSDLGELPMSGNLHALEIVRYSEGALSTLKTAPLGR